MERSFVNKAVQDKWLYHSGLSEPRPEPPEHAEKRLRGELVDGPDRRLRFVTAKYDGTHQIVLRSDVENDFKTDRPGHHSVVNGLHHWEFDLPRQIYGGDYHFKLFIDSKIWQVGDNLKVGWKQDAIEFSENEIVFAYVVEFWTHRWRPAHLVTVRTNVDGTMRDIFGTFGRVKHGVWQYLFEYDQYPTSFEASLVLDRCTIADGHPFTITDADPNKTFHDVDLTFKTAETAYTHQYENFVSIESESDQRLVRHIPRESDHYDVIVLGSGMGGGVLADALSDRRHRVLVIEAGGIRYPVHMNELPREDASPVQRDRLGHYRYGCTDWFDGGVTFSLGGRSVYWSGLIPRMTDWEFRDVWPRAIRDYFLTTDDETKTGYDRAEKLMRKRERLGPYQDDVVRHLNSALEELKTIDLPMSLHQPNIKNDNGTITLKNVLTRSTGCFSTADLLLDSLGKNHPAGKQNLRVALHHFITHIRHADGKATGVVCQDLLARTERTYTGKYIILCCGSVESPKIALNSQLADPNYLVGKGFSDHPAYFYSNKHELPTTGELAWLGVVDGHAKLLIRHKDASAVNHPYHMEVLINPRYWDLRHSDDDLEQADLASDQKTVVELKFIFDSELNDENHITSMGPKKKVTICIHPNRTREEYREEIVQVRNQVLTSLGVPAWHLSNAWHDTEWSQGIKGTVHHAGGSLRCSSDASGVVDENLKFEAYDNLYCCDVSVYPSIPAANPSLTLVGLAQRLAKHLDERLASEATSSEEPSKGPSA